MRKRDRIEKEKLKQRLLDDFLDFDISPYVKA